MLFSISSSSLCKNYFPGIENPLEHNSILVVGLVSAVFEVILVELECDIFLIEWEQCWATWARDLKILVSRDEIMLTLMLSPAKESRSHYYKLWIIQQRDVALLII